MTGQETALISVVDAERSGLPRRPLPFDSPHYAPALAYLGTPRVVAGVPMVLRSIAGSDAVDAFGPFPYGSPPGDPGMFRRELSDLGVVTWTAVMRPGADARASEPFDPLSVKEHFIHRRAGPPLEHSPKTRTHIRRGTEYWSVELCPLGEVIDAVDRLHLELAVRAPLSRVARVDRAHFECLAAMTGIGCTVARANGKTSAFLIFAEADDEIHFHLTAGDANALRYDGMYAIFDFMARNFGATHDLFFGGTPAGANGKGVAHFKARFANARLPVLLARAVIDPGRCSQLVDRLGQYRWFPPYRDPLEDQGISAPASLTP